MSQRRLVLIESPFSADTREEFERNQRYLKACFIDAFQRGESPYASHALFPQFLHDSDEYERDYGIACGYDIGHAFVVVRAAQLRAGDEDALAPRQVFYIDLGESRGMVQARYEFEGELDFEIRYLGDDWEDLLEGREAMRHIKLAEPPPAPAPTVVPSGKLDEIRKLADTTPTDEVLGRAIRKILG